jgi:phosphatidylserine/phosphatidylglycerophosphate/cardiolipin synthase-like enzyme
VKFLKTAQLHAKLVVADGIPFVGSQNYSWTSMTKNREIGLFVTEPTPQAAITAQFEADWRAGAQP